jgi:hypothetical protein
MDELLQAIMESNLDVHMGKHSGIPGFFATVYSPTGGEECVECGTRVPMCWTDSGHGLTLKAALRNAIDMHNGYFEALPRNNFTNLASAGGSA